MKLSVNNVSVCVIVGPPGGYGLPGTLGPDCKGLVAGPTGDHGCPGPDGEPGQSLTSVLINLTR